MENFCALAFFRIKPFKEKFIECLLLRLNDEKIGLIDQWLSNFNDFDHLKHKKIYIRSFFSWETGYYDYL